MKKLILIFSAFWLPILTSAQAKEQEKLIELGKAYKDFMFRNEPNKETLKDINASVSPELKIATEFIVQTITTENKLLKAEYLARPADDVLKQIYIIAAINQNVRKEDQVDNNKLVDSLKKVNIPVYELVDNYYDMLFTAIGNKNQPFDFSRSDFKLKEYSLKDDTEKGIFFLRCMGNCNSTIWGFMNVVKPPNTQKAYSYIKKYPKFNGRPYYQYTDLFFPDFEMVIIEKDGKQSYKSYYLDKYFETLLFHMVCLNKEGGSEKEATDLLLGSILRESSLYKYTAYKDVLEDMLKEVKKD